MCSEDGIIMCYCICLMVYKGKLNWGVLVEWVMIELVVKVINVLECLLFCVVFVCGFMMFWFVLVGKFYCKDYFLVEIVC